MDLKQLFNDDDAVSPVIGVILMVAITVILAAVIASFVLGLGDQTQTTPTASFNFDYDADNSEVEVTHGGGDTINSDELYLRGSNGGGSGDFDLLWTDLLSGGGSATDINAGNSVTLEKDGGNNAGDMTDSYEVNVVYVSAEGDTSSTLSSDKGPNA